MNKDTQPESGAFPSNGAPPLYRRPLTLSLASGICLCLAFPLFGLWPLALLAPVGWLVLIERADASGVPWFYRKVWLGSWVHWLGTVYFVILPHWAGFIGWIAMSLYLSIYYLLFVAGARILVHRVGISFLVAAPVAWVAVDWLRAHVITGFGMAMLPHTMFKNPILIQTADLAGEYGTSFLMVLISASLVAAFFKQGQFQVRKQFLVVTAATAIFAVGYGWFRIQTKPLSNDDKKSIVVGLIQGSIDVTFPDTIEESDRILKKQFQQYRDLTIEARKKWSDLDAVIWPESIFPQTDFLTAEAESENTIESDAAKWQAANIDLWRVCTGAMSPLDSGEAQPPFANPLAMIAGAHTIDPASDSHFNSVLYFDQGHILKRYFKNHRVMFGEYVPFGEYFPFVYNWMPISGGLTPGTAPVAIDVNGFTLSPSICFESTVTHLIRRHYLELQAKGETPDALVNSTNDGWFYGSNCLDLHLACNVFRAVELRTPVLVAANTGFSAHIDGEGRLISVGPRRSTDVLRAEVSGDDRTSLYLVIGDRPAMGCVIALMIGFVFEIMMRMKTRSRQQN